MIGWMIFAMELFMLITGLMAVILGRFPYRPGRPVTGVGAYIGGAIMMVPLLVGLPMTYVIRDNSIMEHGAGGAGLADYIGKVLFMHILLIILCFPGAYITAAVLYNPDGGASRSAWLKEVENRKRRRRSKSRSEEDEEDRPRRRRRRRRDEEDYADDRPRRRYDNEPDDAPPPRRYSDDDDDLRHSHRPGPPPMPRG